ncbi:hypothetical protein PNK_2166 [Candidatus Protochlamydia naegleriophila]|uniref:Uncharacterized protein n=1 Tax=Candidatus Protochlamydia naegleriophila TaxID=389348 RepID=A0A0U5JF20_9BACT|nr:hypothetical protein [Candidatus Protochlamydia naegleriophila]CUI17767.1 hypothetical protein PNK_2166 [Candidatus Protochlamydia naegleriophila]
MSDAHLKLIREELIDLEKVINHLFFSNQTDFISVNETSHFIDLLERMAKSVGDLKILSLEFNSFLDNTFC